VPNRGMITLSIMLANIMQGLDNTILNVALPHVQGSLSASLDQIGSGYERTKFRIDPSAKMRRFEARREGFEWGCLSLPRPKDQ
jgi:MFS family permease